MDTGKFILDATCGSRSIWFDKHNPRAIFADKRTFDGELGDGRHFVAPDVIADFTALPFADGSFRLVVFDPPHITHGGESSWLVQKYGKLTGDWREELRQGFAECARVLEPNGILIFKWSEDSVTVRDVLKLVKLEPLFGHKSGARSRTHWICFLKAVAIE